MTDQTTTDQTNNETETDTREVANYHFGYPTYIARVSKKYPFDNYRFMDTGGSIYE
jgi:hypothetical protein